MADQKDFRKILRPGFYFLVLVVLITSALVWFSDNEPVVVSAATDVFAGSLSGGCYLATPSTCKLQVDPFLITIAPGAQLEAFRLQANNMPIYDFSTDVSNPPGGIYGPSKVKLDFAARCNQDYVINLLADDTSHAGFLNVGQTKTITCPVGRYDSFFPFIRR